MLKPDLLRFNPTLAASTNRNVPKIISGSHTYASTDGAWVTAQILMFGIGSFVSRKKCQLRSNCANKRILAGSLCHAYS
jgi:hypothetical protein